MIVIAISRKCVESNVEATVGSCCNIVLGNPLESDLKHQLFNANTDESEVLVLCMDKEEIMTESLLLVPIPVPLLFTSLNPSESIEHLRPFFRGVLRSAIAIWSKTRKQGIDFDLDGIFYRRPFSTKDDLWHQTLVFVDNPHHAKLDKSMGLQDIVLMSFGSSNEGLPRLETFKTECKATVDSVLNLCTEWLTTVTPESLLTTKDNAEVVPVVTTLKETHVPAWLSYSQWMKTLEGTEQSKFITSPLSGPQRVDGPAGSGKTLSLILKCLYTLKEAARCDEPHHSALIVFSNETKQKIIEYFLAPLDEDGFYLKDRNDTNRQSLTVTTLLEWSRSELEPIVGSFDLPSNNASQARIDQFNLVKETLDNHLNFFLKGAKNAISNELRGLCEKGITPVLIRMFLHEFGVVIKGMADGSFRRYFALNRPLISLPCNKEADLRFIFALFEKYEELLHAYGVVDLDDVAVSHIKLLQMPLRREARQNLAFDSVFVDEAHSFNPNELAIFFLLTRRSELPHLVVAVDLPQALSDKGYEDGGLEKAIFEEIDATDQIPMTRFLLQDIRRCPQTILDLVSSIYVQGHAFLSPIRVPNALTSPRVDVTKKPIAFEFQTQIDMMEAVLEIAEDMVSRLNCRRSEILIVLMHEGLDSEMPQRLASRSEMLTMRTDLDCEHRARKLNHFVIGKPEYLHGLDFMSVILVGVSSDEIPQLEHNQIGAGAAAIFETQRVIDLLYIALTRARTEASILYVKSPSFLLNNAFDNNLIIKQSKSS